MLNESKPFAPQAIRPLLLGPLATVAVAEVSRATEEGPKKLKVFIMAGQSSMMGHSRGHTMATLFNADGPKDKALVEMVFGKDTQISRPRFDEALALGKQLNELCERRLKSAACGGGKMQRWGWGFSTPG